MRNFTRTAEQLDLTQTAISQQRLTIRHRFALDGEVLAAGLENSFELGLVSLKPDDLRRLGFIDHLDGMAMASRLFSQRFPGGTGVRNLRISGFTNQISLILEPVSRVCHTGHRRHASGCGYVMVAALCGMATVGSRPTGFAVHQASLWLTLRLLVIV